MGWGSVKGLDNFELTNGIDYYEGDNLKTDDGDSLIVLSIGNNTNEEYQKQQDKKRSVQL